MKKILAAIDFSNATKGIITAATQMAKAFGAELHLIHIIEPEPTYTAYGFAPEEFPAIQTFHTETRTRAQKILNQTSSEILSQGITPIIHLDEGSALQTLEVKVKEISPDLLILGSHGHGVIASLILGSVAEGIVRKALIPTLLIPAKDAE